MAATKLTQVAKTLQAKYGSGAIGRGDTTPSEDRRMTTGSLRLDAVLGGGMRIGWVTSFYGEKSGGKSTTAIRCMGIAQNHCRNCLRPVNDVQAVPPEGVAQEDVKTARWGATGSCTCYAEGLYQPDPPPKETGESPKVYRERVEAWIEKLKGNSYEEMVCAWIDMEHCLAEGTLVYDAEECRYVAVEDLYRRDEFRTLSFDSFGVHKEVRATVTDSGVREVFQIEASGGRTIRLTANHKILTDRGYLQASEVRPGDVLYSPRSIAPLSEQIDLTTADPRYRLLGLHIGDGCHGKPEISNIDPEVIRDIELIVSRHGCTVTVNQANVRVVSSRHEFRITRELLSDLFSRDLFMSEIAEICGCDSATLSKYANEFGLGGTEFERRSRASVLKQRRGAESQGQVASIAKGRKNEIHLWLEQFECFFSKSGERRLPKGLGRKELAQVIAGIFMADGTSVDPSNQSRALASFSTNSRNLVMDLQAAMLRFGIHSSRSFAKKAGYDVTYILAVSGVRNVRQFLTSFPIYSYKRERLERAVATVADVQRVRFKENLIEHRVKRVSPCDPVQTYDISLGDVDFDQQNFLAEGLVVHNSFDKGWAVRLGLDTRRLLYVRPESAEESLDIIAALIGTIEVDMLCIDSIANLTPTKELTDSMEQWQQGLQARLVNKGIRKLITGSSSVANAHRTITQIWINQVRDKITMFGDPTVKPGGKGQEFAVHAEVKFGKSKIEMDTEQYGAKDEVIKIPRTETFSFKCTKNRTAGTKDSEGFYIQRVRDTDAGKAGEIVDGEEVYALAMHYLVDSSKKGAYRLADREYTSQKAIAVDLRDDAGLYSAVRAALLAKLIKGAR